LALKTDLLCRESVNPLEKLLRLSSRHNILYKKCGFFQDGSKKSPNLSCSLGKYPFATLLLIFKIIEIYNFLMKTKRKIS